MDAFGKEYHYECLLNQSVSVLSSFKCSQWLKKTLIYLNNILFRKDTEKGCVFITSERPDANYCENQDKKNFVHVSIMNQTSFWGALNIVHQNDCVAIL